MWHSLKRLPLHWKIMIGLVLGIGWAFLSSFLGISEFTQNWIAPWGTIFIDLLKLIAIPLILFSIIKGISNLSDVTRLGGLGIKTLLFYVGFTVMAIAVGLILSNTIRPGHWVDKEQLVKNRISYEMWVNDQEGVKIKDGKSYLGKEKYKKYVEAAKKEQQQKKQQVDLEKEMKTAEKKKEQSPLQFVVDIVPDNVFAAIGDNSKMLQIIFFAIFFGIALVMVPEEKARPVIKIVDGITEVFLIMVHVIMRAAPFFVFALLAGQISELAGNNPAGVIEIFKGLGTYSLVVLLGLGIMVVLLYPLFIKFFTERKLTFSNFFRAISPAQTLAFSTSSSAATLPVTMECVHENLGVSREITDFVLPIGATINMDGTSLYQSVAVLFLAQFHLVDLSLGQQLTIVGTATLASIGAAAVPSAGLIMLIIVLESVGLNPAWIAIIFPVDRILDMCRTVVNITGDSTVASLIGHSEGELNPPKAADMVNHQKN